MEKNLGMKLISGEDVPAEVRELFSSGNADFAEYNGQIYYPVGDEMLCCDGNGDTARLMYALLRKTEAELLPGTPEEAYYRLLRSPEPGKAAEQLIQMHIPDRQERTVVLFRTDTASAKGLYASFREIVPKEKKDCVLPLDAGTVAVIMDCSRQDEDEISEYAAAAIETMESEGTTGMTAGIGTAAGGLTGLRESCREAEQALRTGKRFHPGKRVYRYSEMALERIVGMIPDKKRRDIRTFFFHCRGVPELNAELLETVEVFFRNDLNLTAASKQLFIHRNTLNYRLDKIRRETGLDLRKFQDAVVFRIILSILNDSALDGQEKEVQ